MALVLLHCRENNKAHNTDEISVDRLIVRRGKPFLLTLQMKTADMSALDKLEFTVQTGLQASEALRTKAMFRISPAGLANNLWNASIQEKTVSSVTLSVSSPAEACIGEYSLRIKTASSFTCDNKFILLFNPWCSDDSVYIPQESDRREYVMNEHGLLYIGSSDYIFPKTWTFGQFEQDIVDICLKLMDRNLKCLRNKEEDFSARCSPIYVSRVLCAMINAQDDGGVLHGKWCGDFSDGTSPTSWNNSVQILRKWARNYNSVKYGQCWVFAAVLCTVLRCVGIPSRVVTNFQSAHDTDGNLVVDQYRTERGHIPEKEEDSIWNFHVWVEAWMRRPDLSGDFYDGWQVVDPTPQETSNGLYCCGPAPVKAVLEGHVDVKYDVPFVFAEVNADIVTWMILSNGSKIMLNSDTCEVGQNISTKMVGMDKRSDITASYKYTEGTQKERQVYKEAVKRGTKPLSNTPNSPPGSRNLQLKLVEVSKSINGKDISHSLVLKNSTQASKKLQIHVLAQVMLYNGVPGAIIWTKEPETLLLSSKEMSIPIQIAYPCYATLLGRNTIRVSAVVTDLDNAGVSYYTEKDIVPENPKLIITTKGMAYPGSEMTAEVVFDNPVSMVLTDCELTVSGSGLLVDVHETNLPSIKPNGQIRVLVPFMPYRAGARQLQANFNCNLFTDINTSITVDVKPANQAFSI
uniref:Protein-glutamine gamma-glutamyltransferase 2 n=1 Tax=Paramormyrops kingsleyae TaxID=1676925 RepID=A0A3B3RNH0_9TELE|nr:protein-glutamine gamma-glutamyltransferase 5-like [Paramormyrops kingsleyae]